MKKTDISKTELLKQRKERKRQRKAEKRKKKIIRFAAKMLTLLFVMALLYVGVFTWLYNDNPHCDESNTYEYTAKCVDVEVKRKYSRGVFYMRRIYLEDGNFIAIPEKFFDGANENDIIGKDMTFRIYEKLGSAGEIVAEVGDEDGNKYLTLEEYNKQASDVRVMFTVILSVLALAVFIFAVIFWYDL